VTWAVARATGGSVLLRIEDHDRQRSRPEFDAAILEDLAWLGFVADDGPVRQSEDGPAYERALAVLDAHGLVYACTCSRATFEAAGWTGPGCPGGCRERDLARSPERTLRVALGGGDETWMDLLAGPCRGPVAPAGDPPIRDREGNWTYGFSVVVDDHRQAIGLVVRGQDLLEATPAQIRVARLLGRDEPPAFLHHRLIRRPDGAKLSKASRDTSVREQRAAGATPTELIGRAAAAIGLLAEERPVAAEEVERLLR
jgi:glutamyl-Q tRNA(Asp) synthetase